MRRLGAPVCEICDNVAGELKSIAVTFEVLNRVGAPYGKTRIGPSGSGTATAYAFVCEECEDACRKTFLTIENEKTRHKAELELEQWKHWHRDRADRLAIQRDMYKATRPSNREYRDAVQRHRRDLVEAMRFWRIGGGFFGGGGD